MKEFRSIIIYGLGVIVWIGIVVMIVMQYVPQRDVYGPGHQDTRHIFPNAFETETTTDAYQREFRWIRPSGVIQLFTKPNRGISVVEIDANAVSSPLLPTPALVVMVDKQVLTIPVHPGWRRLQFLVRPPTYMDGYTSLPYQVTNTILQDSRGGLGVAVHRVVVMPTQHVEIDWMWVLYILIISILVVVLWLRIGLPAVWLIGIGSMSALGLYVLLPSAEWYLPTAWSMLALCAYPVVLYCVRPFCRPLEYTHWQLVVTVLLAVACLRWAFVLGLVLVAIIYLWGPRTIAIAEFLPKKREFIARWLIVYLTGLAAIVRFWDIDGTGMGLFRDEARHGALTLRILHGEHFAFSSLASLPSGYFYLSTIPIALFGVSPFAIRFVAAVAGVVTIPLVVWVLRPLWGRQVAVVVAALFTMSLWHISISRMGFPISLGPVDSLIAIGAIERATRPKSLMWKQLIWAGICGVMIGSTTLIYHSARLMPAVIVIFGMVFAWRRQLAWSVIVRVVLVTSICALVAAFPIIKFATEYPYEYWYRIKLTSLVNWADLHGIWWGVAHIQNMIAYAGMWLVRGDANPRQYSFGLPQLDLIAGSGFLVGVWMWWQYRRDILSLTVGVWFVVSVLAGIFSVDAPHAWRSAENMTPTFIIAAWGIVALMRPLPQLQIYRLILLVTTVGVIYSGATYMAIQHTPEAFDAFEGPATAAVRTAKALSADTSTQVGLVSALFATDAGQFLLPNTSVQPVATVLPPEWAQQPATIARQVVITSMDQWVEWSVPHETYVARDPWNRPIYVVLCRGECQSLATQFTPAQMEIGEQ